MKNNILNIIYFILLLTFSCNSENAFDCIQESGSLIEVEVNVPEFQKILINRDVTLTIKEASNYKVIIETGENLINDVEVLVIDNTLVLTDNNNCNFVRDYGITNVYVEAPDITEIWSSSQYQTTSIGTLNYSSLRLISQDFSATANFASGDFRLTLNTETLFVESNQISFFYINGVAENLEVNFYSGAGRFEAENLITQHIKVNHRGTNDMVVNPIQSITGKISSTGNVIAVNEPPVVDVETIYTGQLIFN